MVLSILRTLIYITWKPLAMNPYVGGRGARKIFKLGVPRVNYFYVGAHLVILYVMSFKISNLKL